MFYLNRLQFSAVTKEVNKVPTGRTQVFISYAHKDSKYRFLEDLLEHLGALKKRGLLDVWTDQDIEPGAMWLKKIREALASARVGILLVSPSFLASSFIKDEEVSALLRAARDEGATIIPVIVRPCLYNLTELKDYQAFNSPDHSVSAMNRHQKDKLWRDVAAKALAALDTPTAPEHPATAIGVEATSAPIAFFFSPCLSDLTREQLYSLFIFLRAGQDRKVSFSKEALLQEIRKVAEEDEHALDKTRLFAEKMGLANVLECLSDHR